MEKRWFAVTLVVLLGNAGSGELVACGDKFLVPSRGMRFGLSMNTRQEAAILLYANPLSALSGTLERLSINPALRKAGYRPTVIATALQLDEAMQHGGWDVVLIDLADGPAFMERAIPAEAPAVVAVAHDATGVELTEAKRRYAAVLRSPKHSQTFVDAIDEAVALRRETHAKPAKQVHR